VVLYFGKMNSMKNKISNELVMKKYLDENFATKKDLDKKINEVNTRIGWVMQYLEFHLEPLRKFIEDFAEFRNQTQTSLDKLSGDYQKFDEEHMILTQHNSDINNRLEGHEIRIVKLEKRKTN